MLSYLTYYGPPGISDRLWSLWPQLEAAVQEWAADYWENLLVGRRSSVWAVGLVVRQQRSSSCAAVREWAAGCWENLLVGRLGGWAAGD